MKADEILDNIIAAAEVIAKKLPKVLQFHCLAYEQCSWSHDNSYIIDIVLCLQNWKNVKVLHLKTLKSVALPIFTARISNLDELDKEPNVNKKQGEVTIKKSKTFHKLL